MKIRIIEVLDISAITLLCQRGMEFDEINEALIWEKTLNAVDYIEDLNIACEIEGRVVGFGVGCIRSIATGGEITGCIRMLAVDRAYRRRGVASEILTTLESRLRKHGVSAITIMDAPKNYYMPGVDFRYTEAYCFLTKLGYSVTGKNQSLRCDLDISLWQELDETISALAADGFEIRRASIADKDGIFPMLDQEWPAWKIEVENSLSNTPETIFVAVKGGEVVAFSGYLGNNKSLPWFGPMGTLPICRGKGIGALLLRLCLRELARLGWDHAIIPWVGPIPFYSRFCNAKIDRCFWTYKKDFSGVN